MFLSHLLMVVATLGVATEKDAPSALPALAEQAVIRPVEVRMRRLHVVRPDLIRFPIVYDTVC